MNYAPLIDSSYEEYSAGLINIMKAFNIPLDSSATDFSDLLDVQTIMKEGKVQDLAKCIQSLLNYNLNSLTNNSNIRILDPSFITLFHVAQFIIKFLLFWKTDLLNENVKLRSQLQEQEMLRKDYFLKKLEARDLRRQLSLHLQSKSALLSECSQCKKVFINDTYLYAHHKRRHGDLPFVTNRNEIQTLQNKIHDLKQQLTDVQEVRYNVNNSTSPKSIKMKLVPEKDCLETQEKYWKGRIKELCDSYEEEKRIMKNTIDELRLENTRFIGEINDRVRISQTKSVEIQTDSSSFTRSEYFQPLRVEKPFSSSSLSDNCFGRDFLFQSTTFDASSSASPFNHRPESAHDLSPSSVRRWSIDACSKPQQSPSQREIDVVDEVNSFLVKYSRKHEVEEKKQPTVQKLSNGNREEVLKVIGKLFTSDESSEQLANTLISIYDKRSSFVPENGNSCESKSYDSHEGPEFVSEINTQNKANEGPKSIETENGPHFESNQPLNTDGCANGTPFNTSETVSLTSTKPKSKIFPSLKNIPTKIIKKYIKSRRVCAGVIEDKIINRLPSARSFGNRSKRIDSSEVEPCDEIEVSKDDIRDESEPLSFKSIESDSLCSTVSDSGKTYPNVKLVSALKKSRSTGNLVKKVVFTDELPSVKTNSESELSHCSVSQSRTTTNTVIAGKIDVHYDKFLIPVPAPRARKNIVSSTEINQ